MTKLREPRSFEDAITRILGYLGAERAAQIVGKSTRWVRQWSDPDEEALPNLRQAAALDAACKAETGETPIRRAYDHETEALLGGRDGHTPVGETERICQKLREDSEMVEAYVAYHAKRTPAQLMELKREGAEAIAAIEAMIRDCEVDLERQARPQAVA